MDRNNDGRRYDFRGTTSLSARRAWIEITVVGVLATLVTVALRKESVDRNDNGNAVAVSDLVALRKESVDRNSTEPASLTVSTTSLSARRAWIEISGGAFGRRLAPCRSPQGERG